MSEGIWIGGHYTDDEERQQIEQEYQARQNNGGQVYQQDQGQAPAYDQGAYYDGQMPAAEPTVQEQAAAMPEQPAEPQPSTAWMANPANFAEVWQKFDQDPTLQSDDHYSREQVETLYDYYAYKNPGKTMDQWQPLMDNDEFVTKEILRNDWYDPAKEAAAEQAAQNAVAEIYNPSDPTKQEFFKQQELGDWNDLDWIGKLATALTLNDEGVGNMPNWAKKSQAAAKALSSAMAGPATLKIGAGLLSMAGAGGAAAAIANPIVLGAVALATGGLAFYQAYTGKEIPVFGKFLELSDLADTVTEHALGFGSQAIDIGRQNFAQAAEDPNDSYGLLQAVDQTFKDIGQHAGAMWDTGEYFYEMHGSVGDFAIDALKEIFKGEEGTKEGEAWFFNRGINEKQQLAEGTYGSEGERNIREMIEEMDAAGIDKDLRNSLIQQAVINVSGTSGNVSDYVAQMMLDLDIISTPLQNEGAGLISRITGDQNGIRATEMGRKTGVLSDAPFIGQIYNAVTGNSPTSGIMEWMDNRRTLARSTDVSQLTAADRFFGGINADGTIKEFARTERTGLTDMLPESKVAGVGNIANNVMNAYLYDVKDTADLRNRLASMRGDADAATEYQSGLNNSADVLTVREGIRHAMTESDPEVFIRQFEESEGARRTLAQAAEDLGMDIKDMLSLVSETPEVFEQRVRDYAAQHDGMFAGMNVSESVDPVMTVVKGFTTSKDGKGAPLAWDIRQLQYQITTSLIDSMAKYYTEYYGVKPSSTLNTVFDTMKSAQSLLLLGWSPSYFINNVINNAVTSAAEGVLGFMTPKQINQWMTAFGVKPARMDADINAEFRGQTSQGSGGLEAFNRAASDAKKAGDNRLAGRALRELNEVLRRTNDKLGIFSRLSGQMEQLQGNQLTTVAIQQYWGKRWKRGEGFHLMPDSLVETIERQTPGMTDVIYTAIESGLNMEQIGKTLYGTYVMADPRAVMKTVCDNLFRGEASVYEEILEKSGVMNELKERITNCKTAEEREAVLTDVRDRLEKYIENLKREELIQRANDVAATVEAEGLAPVSQIMSEMEMNHMDFWIRQRNEWTEAYNRIKNEGLDSAQARALLADLVSRQQKEWADLYKQEATTAAGIMKGLGFQNQSHAKYIGLMNEKNQNWQAFNEAKSRELNRAYERTAEIRKAAGKGKVDRVRIQEVWDEFHRNVSELYDQHFEKEREYQAKMDAAFVEGYEYSTGKSGEQLRNNFDRIRDIRKQMHDLQQDAHEKTRNMTPDEKAQFYEEFNPQYNALIREIGNLGDANAKIIDDAADSGTPTYEDHNPVTMTAEETVRATEVKDTADAVREKAMRERKGFLDREGIRQGWLDSGRTPAEADLMMQIYDAAADTWAKVNGMYPDEFYSQAARLKGIASWLVDMQNGSLFQMSFDEFAEENLEVVPDVTKRLLDSIKRKGEVTVYSDRPIEDGVDVSISRTEMDYIGVRKIYSRTVPIDQISWGDSSYVGGLYISPTAQQVGTKTIASRLSRMTTEQLMNSRFGDYIRKHFGNQNFREWFGQSKITDEYGLPLVVHHGTPNGTFEVFDPSMMGTNTNAYSASMGFFFAGTDDTAAFYAHGDYDNLMDVYLRIENPFIYDYEGAKYREESYAEIIQKAKEAGHDGVILKNTYDSGPKDNIYIVFSNDQIKSIENDGSFNKLDPNILHQDAQEIVKGTFEPTDIGNIIRMLNASDVSTMVHESGHLFRRTLSQPLMQEFTTWAGFESVAEFNELEYKWRTNDPSLTEAERTRYVEAEEKFARGFEQYLMDGSAPTPGLKAVFKAFRDYLLDIYQSVKRTVTGNDYSGQGEFVFHGKTGDEVLNINAEINGVRLRDIFDRMLTDDVQRMPGYQTLVQELRTRLSQDRHNMRMSDKALSRRAQIEVTKQILQHFGSMQEAEQALAAYDLPLDIEGMRVDDGTLFEAIQAAKADPQMNPFASAERHEVKGSNTYAYSITEANSGKKYQLQYKVMELADLEPSNVWFGDQLIINENYPADLQGRNRAADHSDVYAHAANLNAGLLIDEQHAIDSGAPIVGEGNAFVESGNGRVLSLRYAQEHFPDQWDAYQEYLRDSVDQYGIDPASLDSFENPVLVRERLGGDAVSFAEDANTNRNKAMTASENALTDANKVNMTTLSLLDIQPGEGIETFTTEKNAQPSVEWLRSLPESERNKYSTINRNGDLVLSTEGTARFTNALFATLYATPESMEIIRSFAELADSNIQAVESALKATLPEMARAEGLIKTGSRAENLSITGDIMAAAGLLLEARKAGINIHDYLAQSTIPGLERWTPTQALLAGFFGDAKNNVRMIKDFINAYGEEVYKAADPNQMSFGFEEPKTREQMINDSLTAALQAKQDRAEGKRQPAAGSGQQPAVAGPAAAVQYGPWVEDPVTKRKRRAVTHPDGSVTYQSVGADVDVSEDTPALKQSSVMDSDGKWSGEFAKVLDENKQRTFDDGMSLPLDQAEEVYLTGEQNVKYETMVQRWLRDFTNSRNLTADQYLYAWDYLEWWVQGSEGEAPKGNPIWEEKIRKMVMQDFTGEHGDLVSELQRRYKRGAEVDPTAVPNKGEFFKRTYGFEHGFWNIAGNVYKDGKLVAWLPEELDRMQKTIEVDGQSYKVLGVDMRNPEGLVYYDPLLEIVRTVNVGKPEGFEEPRNPFAFMRPARQGSTPQTMPAADGYAEIAQKYLFPALDKFNEEYTKADTDARTKQMSGLDLETRAQIEQWLDQDVSEDMRLEKYRAMKYSDMKRDAAMLNYNQRYGFDPILTMLSPYQFWYTRSMWKWAKRMIDKPALGNAYERLKEYEDKNRQENIPSRMAGRWRIPMPFLPDWMGGSYYIDLNSALFPFSQFGESYSSNMNTATLNARAEAILNDLTDAGQITAAEMQNALSTKKGAIWENAYAQAETEVGRNDQLNTLASQFISPNIFTSWYMKKQAGEDPGTLSGTRTGNAIKALTSDIPLVSQIGSVIGDAMTLPEKALRKLYGFDYNEFGSLGDQYIRKQISQMCADGDITWRQALNAMNEKSGTIWEMAADRQRKEAMMKVPGFAGAEAAKQFAMGNANIGDALGAIGVSLLGGGQIYPTGEQELRAEKASRDEAYIRKAAGDSQAVSQWYRDNPNYVTRQATYIQDPEELLKFTLYQNITSQYYAQPYAQQQEILNELGPEFDYAVMNSETRNYKAVPIEKLAEWNARIGGSTPNVGNIDVQGVERVLQLNEPVIDAVAEHDEIKRTMFPGISVIQNGYYALPKSQRKAYLESFPQLSAYWTWNRQYKDEHPEYVRWENERSAYYNEETLYNSYADMSERTQQELEYAKATGNEMSQAAQYELQRLYQKYANSNYMSWQEYIRQLQNWD